jgi:hypothetical protein
MTLYLFNGSKDFLHKPNLFLSHLSLFARAHRAITQKFRIFKVQSRDFLFSFGCLNKLNHTKILNTELKINLRESSRCCKYFHLSFREVTKVYAIRIKLQHTKKLSIFIDFIT